MQNDVLAAVPLALPLVYWKSDLLIQIVQVLQENHLHCGR